MFIDLMSIAVEVKKDFPETSLCENKMRYGENWAMSRQ